MSRLASIPMLDFYPRPPRGGRPTGPRSTTGTISYFYPRPPRGGRPVRRRDGGHLGPISTHALREEGDPGPGTRSAGGGAFLPTPSARRATQRLYGLWEFVRISTHALREEGDSFGFLSQVSEVISTHALREEGDGPRRSSSRPPRRFLPTPSARRATRHRDSSRCWR